jgi:hypothetical protein
MAALNARRPIRPNPLIPILVIVSGFIVEVSKIKDPVAKTNEIFV